jgi:EmrB/QacA subfamily drug resistance transporter
MQAANTDRSMLYRRGRPIRRVGNRSLHVAKPSKITTVTSGVDDRDSMDGLSSRALTLVLLASFMVVLDFSIVNVALPSIRQVLSFSGNTVQWVVTAYAISFSGLLILGGRIADLFGRRRSFISGLLLFAGASLAAGLSGDATTLIVARAVQGVGAALVAPASLALITAHYVEGPRRTRALGLYGATASIGFVAGQVLGGVFVEFMGWASIFLVNVPVGIAAAFLATRLIESDRVRGSIAQLDVIGAVLATATVAAMVFSVSEGTVLGWARPLVLGAMGIAAASLIGFVMVERVHHHPLVDLRLLARPNLLSAGFLNLLLGAWSAGELVVMSLYLQQTLHDSPLVAGMVIAPQGIVGFVTRMMGSRLVRRIGVGRLLIASTFATGVGFLAMTALPSSGHYGVALLAVLPVGFGTVGTVFGTTVIAATGMANSDQGLVGGVINTTRQVGAALGVTVLVAVAEGSHAASGTTTIGGDRMAMLIAGFIGLSGTMAASFAMRRTAPPLSTAVPAFIASKSSQRQGGEHEIHHVGQI